MAVKKLELGEPRCGESATYRMMDVDKSDTELLTQVGSGDCAALEVLYERHATAVLRHLIRFVGDHGIAEEILQETWLAVWQSAGSFGGRSAVRSWLIGIARRQAHNRLRGAVLPTVPLDPELDIASRERPVDDRVLAAAGHARLVDAIRGLPPHVRETAMLAWVDEMTYGDIAAVLDIPVGTVKSRIFYARANLALQLSNYEVTT